MQTQTIDFSNYINLEKTELDLSKQNITDAYIPRIISFLNVHPEIKSLDLSSNNIGAVGG